MTRQEKPHWDVAAYALGVLDPREVERYEHHLAGCAQCATELEFLMPAGRLLADVDPDELRGEADTQLLDRLLDSVHIQRYQLRRRRRVAAAVGSVVVVAVTGLALLAGGSWLGSTPGDSLADPLTTPDPTATTTGTGTESPDTSGGPSPAEGEQFTAIDPDSGVHADVELANRAWGTEVSLSLSAVSGPRVCQLVAVTADGTDEVVASWRVPDAGYGTSAQPDPLLLLAATAMARDDINHLQVRELAPDGTVTNTLVTIPV
jgi:hypothetical protein